MKTIKALLLLAVVFTLSACEKNEDGFQLNVKSCVLDNQKSYVEVKKLKGTGSLNVTSSDPAVAEIRFDEEKKDVFYIIGHGQGKATVTVADILTKTGVDDIKTIDVDVCEPITYNDYSSTAVFLKIGESRVFNLPFDFDKNSTLVVGNNDIISVSANAEMGKKCKVYANKNGNTFIDIYKGKIPLFSVRVNVVNEYDLFIPDHKLTIKLPFTYGVNGFSIWRGSGKYTTQIVDETVAEVQSIVPGEDWFNQKKNSASVWVTPLKIGTTKLIVTDVVTEQTDSVEIVVN
jgi:hypothetical protein